MGFELNALVIKGFKISPKLYLQVSHDNLIKLSGSVGFELPGKSDILLRNPIILIKSIEP